MKNAAILAALLFAVPAAAQEANPDIDFDAIWNATETVTNREVKIGNRRYDIGFPLELKADVIGARDYKNNQWLVGAEVDLLWLRRLDEDKPTAYLAINNLYNVDARGKGSIGFAIGTHTGKAGQLIEKVAKLLIPAQAHRLEWLSSLSNWVTIEFTGGYRVFGTPDGVSPWIIGVGGKVQIPIDLLWGKK